MSESYQAAQIAELKDDVADIRRRIEAMMRDNQADARSTAQELQQINLTVVKMEQILNSQGKWQEKAGGMWLKFLGVVLSFIILGVLAAVFPGGIDK